MVWEWVGGVGLADEGGVGGEVGGPEDVHACCGGERQNHYYPPQEPKPKWISSTERAENEGLLTDVHGPVHEPQTDVQPVQRLALFLDRPVSGEGLVHDAQ